MSIGSCCTFLLLPHNREALTRDAYSRASSPILCTKITYFSNTQVHIEVISLENLLTAFQNYLPVLLEAVEEGLQNPLDAFTQVRQICNLAEFNLEKIKPFALKEAEFFHKDELYQLGFEISSTGDTFNFSEDPEVKRLENLLKHRKDLIKSAARHQKTILDEASGEIIKPVSIRSHSTQYLKTIKPK